MRKMFNRDNIWEDQIDEILNVYSIEEALEVLDITPEQCIKILLEGGHAVLPQFLDRDMDYEVEE